MQIDSSTVQGFGGWLTLAQAGGPALPGSQGTVGSNPGAPGTPPGGAPSTTAPGGSAPSSQAPAGGNSLIFVLPVLLIVFMIVSQVMAGRREKKKRAELLSSISKHDKVQTIGGIIGTVAEVRDDEIVLRVDENSNTRIRFTRSAIQQVIKSSDAKPAGSSGGGGVEPSIEVRAGAKGAKV